jgi:alpha-glucosidase
LIVFSGLTVLPDSADSYREHRRLFEFIAAQKMPWVESRTLAGEIGRYIVMMRKTGDTYLVASATNEEARQLNIPLDFLGPGTYQAVLYEDAPDAHYLNNREAYRVREQKVTAGDVIEAHLAPGGGHCIKLTPVR